MCVAIFIVVLILIIAYWYLKKPKNLPPGPTGIPILGYIPWLAYHAKDRIKLFEALQEKYGNVVCMKTGFSYMIVLNDIDVIKEAFINKGESFSGRGLKMIQSEITGGKGILSNEGKYQRENRRFMLRSLRNMGFGKMSFEEPINETVKDLCDRIDEHIASHPGESMDLSFDVIEAVADNITQILLGTKFNKQQLNFMIECLRGIEKVPATFFLMNAFPFIVQLLKFKFVEKFVGIQQFKNIRLPLEDMVMKYVKEHKDSYNKDNISDFIYSYIEEQSTHQDSETDKYWWDDDQIKHACAELLGAGMGTTEATVTWSLMLMGNNPELQKKVHKEIQNVIGLERLPSTRDLQSLPLCEASILEILRWSVLAPTGIPYAVTQDCEFEGYFIPKDTAVLANLYSISRDKKVWLDPENFNPEANFLSADKSQVINRDKMIPFGVGRRSCIGESLARMEITLFFLGIFQKFDVSIDPKYGLPKPSTGLFRVPSHRKVKFRHY